MGKLRVMGYYFDGFLQLSLIMLNENRLLLIMFLGVSSKQLTNSTEYGKKI